MADKPNSDLNANASPMEHHPATASQFRERYESQQALLNAQSQMSQRFIEAQARQIADAIVQKQNQVKFMLPDRVITDPAKGKQETIPAEQREQTAAGFMDRITRTDLRIAIRQRLLELETNPNRAITTAALLVRHALVMFMVHSMLPSGRTVRYVAADGETIPTIPADDGMEPESAITAATDAIAEEGQTEAGRGELLVPYVPYARRFYLPQWVAFDDQGKMLVSSLSQAEAHIASMQQFLWILHSAVSLAPYMVADEEYQLKRYGMLGQLVNQGRALALYQMNEIINTIKHRASMKDLNRGLGLSLPYFDDQALEVRLHDFDVIPGGRVMFVPAFVVLASREEQVKVAQDTRFSLSTREHLLHELLLLEAAFENQK
jgi:hypothetical protein